MKLNHYVNLTLEPSNSIIFSFSSFLSPSLRTFFNLFVAQIQKLVSLLLFEKNVLYLPFVYQEKSFSFSEIKFEALSKLIASNQVIVMDVRNHSELQDTGILPKSHSVPRTYKIQRILNML